MTAEIAKLEFVRTTTGKCYAGMTAEDAVKAGNSVFREFKQIDNADGVLSAEEIFLQRSNKETNKHSVSRAFMILGAIDCAIGLLDAIRNSGSKIQKAETLLETLIFTGISIYSYSKAKKINKETQKMSEKYNQTVLA